MKFLISVFTILISLNLYAQSENKEIYIGNSKYKQNDVAGAELNYTNALVENPESEAGNFNLGNTQYLLKNYDKAVEAFKKAAETTSDPKVRAQAYHNMGNALLEQKKYQESIDSYKQALRNDPTDQDTKYNLAYAQKMLKQQQDQKQKENEQQEQKKKEEKKEEPKKEDQKKDPQQKQEPQPEQSQPKQYTKEELDRILQSLNADDKNVQDKINKQKVKSGGGDADKDW